MLNYEEYAFQRWHGTLIAILNVALVSTFNIVGVRFLPLVETFALILHLAGFFAYIIPVWVMGESSPGSVIWTEFLNEGGWASIGGSTLVGLITPVTALIASDCCCHLSEELRNASKSLPRAMLATLVVNGSLGLITAITFAYHAGDLEELLSTPTGFPFIQLYYNATGSKAGTTAMTSIVICLALFNAIANVAASSRQLFAFARDRGFPFHKFFGSAPQEGVVKEVPLNAILFTSLVSGALACINIGSTVALNQIFSLGLTALPSSYLVSTGCIALKRIRGERLLSAHFVLSKRSGLLINMIGLAFAALALVTAFFPPINHPPPATMNWAILVYGTVVLFSIVYYLIVGRHRYEGPVAYVRKLE